jgi:hypothetical protein
MKGRIGSGARPRIALAGIPWKFPLGEVSGVLASRCASIQLTEVWMYAVQISDHRDICGAIAVCGQDALGTRALETAIRGTELRKDRFQAANAVNITHIFVAQRYPHQRGVLPQTSAAAAAPRGRFSCRPDPCHCG